jgi:DNA-binding NtrC family response regulator
MRAALRQGRFRDDLYYRLRVVPIEVLPLRSRREDIPLLLHHFLNRVTSQRGLVRRISPQAMRILLDYAWPGNVRELANAIEYAVVVARRETILPDDLPQEILHPCSEAPTCAAEPPAHPANTPQTLELLHCEDSKDEAGRLLTALEKHHWKRAEAAKELRVSRSTLWRKIKEFKLQ